MTVQIFTRKVSYSGNNSTSVFYSIPYPYLDESAWIEVSVVDVSGSVTELVPTTDFVVVVGQGVLTTAAWDSSYTLTISRSVTIDQLVDYVENGKFPAESHEYAMDKLTMVCQDILEELSRCVRVSIVSDGLDEIHAIDATDQVFGYDADGNCTLLNAAKIFELLSQAGYPEVRFTQTWADDAARAALVPEFVGQIGIQLDKNKLDAFYHATALTAGAWTMVQTERTQSWADDTARAALAPEFVGQLGVQLDRTGLDAAWYATGISAGDWAQLNGIALSMVADIATNRLLGRTTAGSGSPEEITIGTGFSVAGTTLNVAASAPNYDDVGNITTNRLLGRYSAGTGVAELVTLDSSMQLSGTGVLAAGALVQSPTFVTASGTFNFNSRTRFAIVELQGAGAGGGGFPALSASQAGVGQGGCAGGYCLHFVDVSALSTKSATLTIGAAGVGVYGNSGTNGGDTTYSDETSGGSPPTAAGGTGGSYLNPLSGLSSGASRASRSSSNASIYNVGSPSDQVGFGSGTTDVTQPISLSGKGGDSRFGPGAIYGYQKSSSAAGSDGADAPTGYGAGGGGASGVNSNTAKTGGDGTQGCIVVWEYL